ncbi:MAG: HDIG domain-containing protein, partial [Chlamydiia bacterium]|nr:HDIG domain-containing protein [Chlamydiia bacterium]
PTAAEATVTKVPIEQEEIKKRIVGREGRNIRCFENLTGVSLLVDETPGAIVISTFDPIRQEIARKSLQSLIFEGRIHPSRIEEVVMEQKDKMDQTIRREGEEACIRLGINDLHHVLIYRIGKLKFHQSLGQNLLTHSSEVATLMELLAAELNLDTTLAKRIGLLHDIGKTEKSPLPHATVGAKLAEKWGESAAVCNGIASHHDNQLPQTVEGALLPIADTLSASRPGARKQAFADYITRLEKLESLVESFPGVQKAYALQSGKEVRVFVDPDAIDDTNALLLSRSLSQAVEKEFRFYGKIKLHLIREKQIVSYAI